jgi:hypothetical protein
MAWCLIKTKYIFILPGRVIDPSENLYVGRATQRSRRNRGSTSHPRQIQFMLLREVIICYGQILSPVISYVVLKFPHL